MSEYGTSFPQTLQRRTLLIRPSSFLCRKLKRRSDVRIAVCSLTGIVTRPKLIAPDQIAWATVGLLLPTFAGTGQGGFESLRLPELGAPEVAASGQQAACVLQREAREFCLGIGRSLARHRLDLAPVEGHRDRSLGAGANAIGGNHRLASDDLDEIEV